MEHRLPKFRRIKIHSSDLMYGKLYQVQAILYCAKLSSGLGFGLRMRGKLGPVLQSMLPWNPKQNHVQQKTNKLNSF